MKLKQLIATFGILLILGLAAELWAQDGAALWKKHQCFTCHGDSGKGDGMVGKSLPKGTMPDFTSAQFQFKFSKDEAKFAQLLKSGGAAVGLNPLMPPAPGLKPNEVGQLYKFILSLKKK
jgi:cytochrome c551/c552